ncbi:hypothetical protein SMICM17S_05612 [Streptomyces microflavus]
MSPQVTTSSSVPRIWSLTPPPAAPVAEVNQNEGSKAALPRVASTANMPRSRSTGSASALNRRAATNRSTWTRLRPADRRPRNRATLTGRDAPRFPHTVAMATRARRTSPRPHSEAK